MKRSSLLRWVLVALALAAVWGSLHGCTYSTIVVTENPELIVARDDRVYRCTVTPEKPSPVCVELTEE